MLSFTKGVLKFCKRQHVLVASVIHLLHNKVPHSGLTTINSNKQEQQGEEGKKDIHKRQLNFQALTKQIEDQKRQHLTKVTYYLCEAKAQAVPAAWHCKAAHTEAPASIKTRSLLIAVKSLCHSITHRSTRHNNSWNVLNKPHTF